MSGLHSAGSSTGCQRGHQEDARPAETFVPRAVRYSLPRTTDAGLRVLEAPWQPWGALALGGRPVSGALTALSLAIRRERKAAFPGRSDAAHGGGAAPDGRLFRSKAWWPGSPAPRHPPCVSEPPTLCHGATRPVSQRRHGLWDKTVPARKPPVSSHSAVHGAKETTPELIPPGEHHWTPSAPKLLAFATNFLNYSIA